MCAESARPGFRAGKNHAFLPAAKPSATLNSAASAVGGFSPMKNSELRQFS
jgi:hypothetical protein